jgi:predicted ATPase/Tfp pilus assembly protein PilF
MSRLPGGTVTFLFTDIEGSTRLLHELGAERYADELAEHRRVLREAFARHGGVEVDTQGDAFFVAFPTAPSALAAASEAQDALELPVRMGLHTGTPLLTEEGYVGPDVHRAARIAAAGHGRQVLVSASTQALLDPDGLRDLGEHRLKDLSAPERIWQLGEGEFPRLKTLYQTNLPVQGTPFVGRERELAELMELLEGNQLVTLTGPGGSGKTRLALQAAAELAEELADGIWFVSLAAISDAGLIEPTVAQVVGARDDLNDFLRGKNLLLLLDNLEQLLPEAAPVVAGLEARVLATSRERLNLSREQEYAVPALPVDEAVALFVQRAQQLRPSFEPDEQVAEIARRLDGLPLALELAAARVKVLTPQRILERLERSLDLLTTGARDAPERQWTLRATIEWSFELLEPREQHLFARLAVFAGSFEVEAAESICDSDLDGLQSLVEKSLLRQTDEGRLFMLETLREYAGERLAVLPESNEVRKRHALWFLSAAEKAEERFFGPDEAVWLDRLERDHDNFRSALAALDEAGMVEELQRLATALSYLWIAHGHWPEGYSWLVRALARPGGDPAMRAKALNACASVAMEAGAIVDVGPLAEESARLYEQLGDDLGVARSRTIEAWAREGAGEFDEAQRLHEEAIALTRPTGDAWRLLVALNNLGNLHLARGDFSEAAQVLEEALELSPAGRFPSSRGRILENLGFARLGQLDVGGAESSFMEALRLLEVSGTETRATDSLLGAAAVAAAQHRWERSAKLMGAVDAGLEAVMRRFMGNERRFYEATVATLQAQLGDRLVVLQHGGRALEPDAAIAYALSSLD